MALRAAGDARKHFVGLPGAGLAIELPAVQAAGGNVHPVECVFLWLPYRAFASGVACVDDEFCGHVKVPDSGAGFAGDGAARCQGVGLSRRRGQPP
ncbi:hypothetical protein D3C71_1562410 [compost metagenome]